MKIILLIIIMKYEVLRTFQCSARRKWLYSLRAAVMMLRALAVHAEPSLKLQLLDHVHRACVKDEENQSQFNFWRFILERLFLSESEACC